MSTQADLRDLWLQAPEGKLCAREQAKAWALREVWRAEGKGTYVMYPFIAGKVSKMSGGQPSGGPPGASALQEFFDKVDKDPEWFPGKTTGTRRGPKRVLRGVKVTAIASAAKRLKAEGEEPTYSAVIAACPQASLNPCTKEPVDKHLVYRVFRECCYDEDPADTWDHLPRLSQSPLDAPAQERRVAFANHMLGLRYTDNWFFTNLVWVDLCRSVLPRTRRKAAALALSRKGMQGWQSKGSRQKSSNKRNPPSLAKLASSDTVAVWCTPILTRGKLHLEPLSENFPGETENGATEMVARVRAALNIPPACAPPQRAHPARSSAARAPGARAPRRARPSRAFPRGPPGGLFDVPHEKFGVSGACAQGLQSAPSGTENDHWLSNEKNCLVLRLTGPAFGPQEAPLHVAGAVPQDRAEMMRAWSVRELALFLTKADMEGPAQQLRAQGVAGEDFLHFTATDLKQDLRTTPFTAKKLLRIRDAYLAGP